LISAAVSIVVATGTNLALGGAMEVRKQRAVARYNTRTDLNEAARIMLNACGLMIDNNQSWGARGGLLKEWPSTNEFDQAFEECQSAYTSARPKVSGHDGDSDETLIGRAIAYTAALLFAVRRFRNDSIGKDVETFTAFSGDMQADLQDAFDLLGLTVSFSFAGPIKRPWRRRRLRTRLVQVAALRKARSLPRTPHGHTAAVNRLKREADEAPQQSLTEGAT